MLLYYKKLDRGLDKIFNWNPKSVEESEEAPRVYDLVNLAQRIIVFLRYYGRISIPKKVRLDGGKKYFTIRNMGVKNSTLKTPFRGEICEILFEKCAKKRQKAATYVLKSAAFQHFIDAAVWR